jgi:hypothetical protein
MKPRDSMIDGKTVAILMAMLGLTVSAANAAYGPFASMAGNWFGGGRVILADGQVENIRCRADNNVSGGGDLMRQHLRCASPSYNFDVQNTVSFRGGEVRGDWAETTHNIGGQLTGTASANLVRAHVQGGQFAADVTLASRRNSLDVTLAPRGTDVREVTVALRRS